MIQLYVKSICVINTSYRIQFYNLITWTSSDDLILLITSIQVNVSVCFQRTVSSPLDSRV